VLDHEVTVEHHALHLGEHGVVTVQVAPARLHHADLRVGEVVHEVQHDARRRHEVGVEHEGVVALCVGQTLFERAGLVARAIGAMAERDVVAALAQLFGLLARDAGRLVRGVVEHLDLELVLRVVDLSDALEQPLRDVHLIEHRQLNGHARQFAETRGRQRRIVLVAPVQIKEVPPMEAVDTEDCQDHHVKNDHEHIHFAVRPSSASPSKTAPLEVGGTLRRCSSLKCHRNVICCTKTSQVAEITEHFGGTMRFNGRPLRGFGPLEAIAC
jgi:hypothetical protein